MTNQPYDTVPFCKSYTKGKLFNHPFGGECKPDTLLWPFCIITALLSGPFLRRPLQDDIPVGEDRLWRNPLKSLKLLLVMFLFWAPCSLQCQGFWCQHKVDHTPPSAAVLRHILFSWFCYILHYAELFLYKLFKNYLCKIWMHTSVFVFEIANFPSGRRELNLYFINTKSPGVTGRATTFYLKACWTGCCESTLCQEVIQACCGQM